MKFTVRGARPSDKEPLMSFIKGVWGGHDYIPSVWDDWIGDRNAKMFVVETGGRAVALNRVRFLEDGSAWFEGVRVHAEFRGMGLATMLGENSMEVARKRGVSTFRLTSGSRNWTAHRQISRMSFGEVARFSVYDQIKGGKAASDKQAWQAGVGDSELVKRVTYGSDEYRRGTGVMWDGFTAFSMTPEVVDRCVRSGGVYALGGAVAFVRPGKEGKSNWQQVCFVGGEPRDAARLVSHAFAMQKGADWKLAYVPQGSSVIHELRNRGMRRSFSMVLFQRASANG